MKRFIFSAFLFFMVFMATAAVFAQGSSAPEMALPAMVVAVLNFFAPLAIQFLKVKMESRLARFWTALLISGLTGIIAAVVAKVDLNNTIELVTISFAMAQLAYNSFWKVLWKNNIPKR